MNRDAPNWLAAIGLVIAVTALWQPGTLALDGARYRLALSLPWCVLTMLAAASLAILLGFSVAPALPRKAELLAYYLSASRRG
jgi:hypothetical protein